METKPSYQESKVLNVLEKYGSLSTMDMVIKARVADPRSIIRRLIRKGVIIASEWRITNNGNRYKIYWIGK